MKKSIKILLLILFVLAIAGYVYWQQHKKGIIQHSIQSAIEKETDSLYYLHYDSSYIDEVNGNASFYNVTLQSDSAQKKLLETSDSLPNAIYSISVAEVSARGIDISALLQNKKIAASALLIIRPVIQIINTGADKPTPFTYKDTLQLYEKILGNFKSIQARSINIINGTLLMTNKQGKPLTTAEEINISLNNFLIDSTRDYNNLLSYFIKDVTLSVANIQLPESNNHTRLNIEKVLYDAPQKKLQISSILQYETGNTKPSTHLKKIVFNQLNTDAFINQHQIKAGIVTCDGGTVTIYTKEKKTTSNEKRMELVAEFIDGITVAGLKTGNTTIIVKNADHPEAEALVIEDVNCAISNIKQVTSESTISSFIENADWEITARGFSFFIGKKMARFSASGLRLNSMGTVFIKNILLKPQLKEEAFKKIYPYQKDRYDISFDNINITGINYKQWIAHNILEAQTVQVQPVLKIFNDRTLPPNPAVTYKEYPQKQLLNIPFQFFVKTMLVKNGAVYYKEKAEKSGLAGMPYFTNINGTLANVTNMPNKIKLNSKLKLSATCLFLGIGKMQTEWVLPLSQSDTVFTVKATVGPMDAVKLNQLTEPLGMLSVKTGRIDQLNFTINGNNHSASGISKFLYDNLTIALLQKKEAGLQKKGLESVLANTLVKNNNPQNGKERISNMYYKRDAKRSFFNLLWKTLLSGVKNTVMGKL